MVDVETAAKDEATCSIVQLAAIAIEPRNLNIIAGSEFNMNMRPTPEGMNEDTLDFHAKRLGKDRELLRAEWNSYPDAKIVWPEFIKYLKIYHTKQDRQTKFTAPIPAGANIRKFDLPILARYNELYGDKKDLWAVRDKIDLLDWFFPWFENNGDITSHSMDNMREYFGMSKENAHDALQDVKDSAAIIIRFMNLFRNTAAKVKFKGAFSA